MIKKIPLVFINASVILAGLKSPSGGSAKVLKWAEKGKIRGVISEVVLDEALKHSNKVNLSPIKIEKEINKVVKIIPAPEKEIRRYRNIVKDMGDIHLFTSSENLKTDYLVSLDKKHVLSLSKRIKKYKIISPGELIKRLEKNM